MDLIESNTFLSNIKFCTSDFTMPDNVSELLDDCFFLEGKYENYNNTFFERENDGIHNIIFAEIMNKCPLEIKETVRGILMIFIETYCNEGITSQINSVKNAHKFYSNSEVDKCRLDQIEVALKSSIVHYLSLLSKETSYTCSNLLEAYPSFDSVESQKELEALCLFRNNMKIALTIIPPKQNKRLLLDICTLLEGQGKCYITGGAQVPATARRVKIYEQESNLKPQSRAPRKPVLLGANRSIVSDKLVKSSHCVACKCGAAIRVSNMWRHLKTAKHIMALRSRENVYL